MHEVSVVIPCHTEKRLDHLIQTVKSVREQAITPVEIVIVVDHNGALYEHLKLTMPGVTVLANRFAQGVSGNRNTGVLHTKTPLVALLDDDVSAHPGWLERMLEPFADPTVIGAGSAIVPVWEKKRPPWFPDEFLWAVGGSYTGMPETTAEIRNVWSEGMVVRRDAFLAVDGFRVGFGKLGDVNRPEDTDLCLRMANATGGRWMYVPGACIDHAVMARRSTLRFYLGRCFNEGRGKVELGRLNDGRESLQSERDYLRKTLPRGVWRGFSDAARGHGLRRAAQAVAIIVGAGFAAAGGLAGMIHGRRSTTTVAPDADLGPGPAAGRELAPTAVAEETV